MKLAYLANIRFPSERAHAAQITHMCQAFSQSGAKVVLFVNYRKRNTQLNVSEYFNLKSLFSVRRISSGYYNPKILLTFYWSELIFSLSFLLSSEQKSFDIVYTRSEWIAWFLSWFIPVEKLVWESHEAKLNFPAQQILKKGMKTITISEGICEDYEQFGVRSQQMLVAHDGIDSSFFEATEDKIEARKRLGLPLKNKVVMYIGGFDNWKGIETFLSAAGNFQDVTFVAIGGMESQVTDFKKRFPKVTFLGQRPYAELRHNQQAANILVVPNSAKSDLSARYTSPLKLFAHMASGVPLVISDIPSLTNVVGKSLVTPFEPDNSQALATSVERVFNDYENKRRAAQELKTQALRYTWCNRASAIIKFLT